MVHRWPSQSTAREIPVVNADLANYPQDGLGLLILATICSHNNHLNVFEPRVYAC